MTIRIQSMARAYIARRKSLRLAQKIYKKFLDNDSRIQFWSNTRLGTSFWKKPILLRELDCGDYIKMPSALEQYTPLCTECATECSSCFCDECDRGYCLNCFYSYHRSGNRKLHTKINFEMCVECGFQVVTKYCNACMDSYCDTCFRHAHRRGRARLHTYKWLHRYCDECDERCAHWMKIDPSNSYQEDNVCTICFNNYTGSPWDPQVTSTFQISNITYRGPTVALFRKIRDDAMLKEKQRLEHEKYIALELIRKREASSRLIQRIYRGHKVRRNINKFVEERKIFFVLRKLEMPKRKVFQYKIFAYFGFAPHLRSDTNVEKIMNLYPSYLHPTVRDIIEGKWKSACEMLVPFDLGIDFSTKKSRGETFSAYMALQAAKMSKYFADQSLARGVKSHEKAKERYKVVRNERMHE